MTKQQQKQGDRPETQQVIIETPRGSRNNYKFDEESGRMKLSKVMPAGMISPYDFGSFLETRLRTAILSTCSCSVTNRCFQVARWSAAWSAY